MARTYLIKLHERGPALWPEVKPLAEVENLRDTTPEGIFQTTWQGRRGSQGAAIFKRSWINRFNAADPGAANAAIARWISFDTGLSTSDAAAFSSCVWGELWPDYRMVIRKVWRDRLAFPELDRAIESQAIAANFDKKLHGVIIEAKASGISAIQTLRASQSKAWIAQILIPFDPKVSKEQRASQAAVWLKNGSVLLPNPDPVVPWLADFEIELFDFPGTKFKDQVDAFSQLILFAENLLAAGFAARTGRLADGQFAA